MIDFHTHTLLSDGALDIAEQIRRAQVAGYRILGVADHASLATMAPIVAATLAGAKAENRLPYLKVVAGVELTHVRPEHMAEAANLARKLGAQIVIAHGETIAEPVQPGTNRAAIDAGVDILAHPGLITEEEARLAAKRNVLLEVTAKPGHALANGHVVAVARKCGARLVFGSDSHGPEQFPSREHARRVCLGAGLSEDEITAMFAHAEQFAKHKTMQQEMDTTNDW